MNLGFLRNSWYAAALPAEIGRTPFARTICGESVVFYRTESGRPVALQNRCSHRFAPLSMGALDGDAIQCAYHGLRFDAAGACVRIPGQARIPSEAHIASYPIVERNGWAWLWIGDAAQAEESKIPRFPWFGEPGWDGFILHFPVRCNYQLLIDNLLDLSHVSFVHRNTIGSNEIAETPIETEIGESRVTFRRIMRRIAPAPMIAEWGGYTTPIDRSQIGWWEPPANFVNEARFSDGKTELVLMIVNPITPETERTSHFWVGWSRNFKQGDPAFTAQAREENARVQAEDIAILEAQQIMIDRETEARPVTIHADSNLVPARRILDRMLAAQGDNLP